jgi:acetyl-CoA carboxylase biotin carboxyl carrier protein
VEKKVKSSEKDEAFGLIEEMLSLMESRNLVELELEREGMKIRLKRAYSGGSAPTLEHMPTIASQPSYLSAQQPAVPKMEEVVSPKTVIKSPMVGTFYRSPAPDAPAFIEAGQDVEVGQVICIIEAMKLMNEIKSEVSGRISEILVQNGDPVEFGQALFAIEPKS